jgi:carbon-monoxide dehydrogenase medium subunit
MKPAAFEYSRPDTLSDAIRLLAEADGSAAPICGGQSLLVLMGLRLTMIERLAATPTLERLTDIGDLTVAGFESTLYSGAISLYCLLSCDRC